MHEWARSRSSSTSRLFLRGALSSGTSPHQFMGQRYLRFAKAILSGALLWGSLAGAAAWSQGGSNSTSGEWRFYGNDPGGMRFSSLKQIDRSNVSELQRAWTYELPANPSNSVIAFEATPIMIDDTLYFATQTGKAIALNAETGEQRWFFDSGPGNPNGRKAGVNRGVAYWAGSSQGPCGEGNRGVDRRIFYVTPDAHLFSLNAETGKPCKSFGEGGSIDLRQGVAAEWPKLKYELTSPPVVYKDLVITGSGVQEYPSKGPTGAVRAFNARTGKLVWQFDTVPKPGEAGNETWAGDSWKDRSGTNAWGPLSVDLQNGLVFLPLGSPTYDFYGADRKGKDLYGDSLVALNAQTGKLVWYYQLIHHDLWDYDPSGQPVLMTLRRQGRDIPAIAEATKTGFIFVFNRLTGKPLFPIQERPVPKSQIPGEASWPTQPFPVAPPPLARTSITLDDISTVTPESHDECLKAFSSALPSRLFQPWGTTLTLEFPGTLGGSNWSGAAFDPSSGNLFVNLSELGTLGEMEPQPPGSPESYFWNTKWGTYARFWDSNHYPCQQPPWGTLNAVNLNTGKIVWKVPLGVVDALEAKGVPKTGLYNLGGAIVTAGGLVFIAAASDHRFRAFDARTGKELWVTHVEANGHATPLTYMGSRSKRQFVVLAVGPGGNIEDGSSGPTALIAYALFPKGQTSPAEEKLLDQRNAVPAGAGSEPPATRSSLSAPAQPVPFSHRSHAIAGIACKQCHLPSADGKDVRLPNAKECMSCHRTVMRDDPVKQTLAHFEKSGEAIPWVQLYKLPSFVFFSHQTHETAKVGCAVCHGPVADRDSLWQEKDLSMASCVNCHRLRKAKTACGTCHSVGY
jgi:glucose dehydrogenase